MNILFNWSDPAADVSNEEEVKEKQPNSLLIPTLPLRRAEIPGKK